MMYWNGSGTGGWGFGLMMLAVLLFLVLLAVGAVALLRHPGGAAGPRPADHRPARPAEPEQVLAERLARGEIDPEEYRSRLAALRQGAPTGRGRTP
ncbi:SHOCT domain-containing protein [Kitasatospora sp. NPDC059646]|uniref:SHOCT domain-containing protein n=1 Tax=Kitasatospora sp. NPDC059646 TaxID=3346893 RepID=UPI0036C2A891